MLVWVVILLFFVLLMSGKSVNQTVLTPVSPVILKTVSQEPVNTVKTVTQETTLGNTAPIIIKAVEETKLIPPAVKVAELKTEPQPMTVLNIVSPVLSQVQPEIKPILKVPKIILSETLKTETVLSKVSPVITEIKRNEPVIISPVITEIKRNEPTIIKSDFVKPTPKKAETVINNANTLYMSRLKTKL